MTASDPQIFTPREQPPAHGRELPLWTVLVVAAGVLMAGLGSPRPDARGAERGGAVGRQRTDADAAGRVAQAARGPRGVQLAGLEGVRGSTHSRSVAGGPGSSRSLHGRPSAGAPIEDRPEEASTPERTGGAAPRGRGSRARVDNVLHGEWISRDRSGTIRERGAYDAGRRVGAWESFSGTGALIEFTEFVDGERHGDWRAFAPEGALIGEGRYQRDLRSEEWTMWYSDGRVKERGTYVNGLREGVWEFYDDLGELTNRSGAYRAGIKVD